MLCTPHATTDMHAVKAVHTISQGTRAAVVASTASCAVVPLWTQLITGPLASVTSGWLDRLLQRCGMHDSSSVVSVHLGGGAIGVVAVGFFAQQVHQRTHACHASCLCILNYTVVYRVCFQEGLLPSVRCGRSPAPVRMAGRCPWPLSFSFFQNRNSATLSAATTN